MGAGTAAAAAGAEDVAAAAAAVVAEGVEGAVEEAAGVGAAEEADAVGAEAKKPLPTRHWSLGGEVVKKALVLSRCVFRSEEARGYMWLCGLN